MAKRKRKKAKKKTVEEGKARAGGMARTTFGRSRVFEDRKKEADKTKCRKKKENDSED